MRLSGLPLCALFLACGAAAPATLHAQALNSYDAARFAAVRSSVANARNLLSTGTATFGVGDWIEIDLSVDEEGRKTWLESWTLVPVQGSQRLRLSVKDQPAGSYRLQQEIAFTAGVGPGLIPLLPGPAHSVRIEALDNGTLEFASLQLFAPSRPRDARIVRHGWYNTRPTPGALTSAAIEIDHDGTDEIGILFAQDGGTLLSAPLYVGIPSQGGLLVDPVSSSIVDIEILGGSGLWRSNFSFPFEPLLLGAQVHFQAAILRSSTLQGVQILWTRPLTFL